MSTWKLFLFFLVTTLLGWSWQAKARNLDDNNIGNIAFYYGDQVPIAELQAFDRVVIDADSHLDPANLPTHTQWLAYVSVGEVDPNRSYAKTIPPSWLIGNNTAWGAKVIDQAAPEWPEFFLTHMIEPLWQRGFRGFFLDTLDSYQLVAKTPEAKARQEAGLVAVIRAIKIRHPDATLIFNRGFEILPQVAQDVSAVAMESLFNGWNQAEKRYVTVSETDRAWLLKQVDVIRNSYKLPVISIDYCAPGDGACSKDATQKIQALGITPYVADGGLRTVGRGRIQVEPRRILIVQNRASDINIDNSEGVRFLAMPLNYLGYKVEYADVKDPLPLNVSSDIYAGIVVWANGSMGAHTSNFVSWLRGRMQASIPVAFMNQFGSPVEGSLGKLLNLRTVVTRPQGEMKVSMRDPMMGFELMPSIDPRNVTPIRAEAGSTPLLQLSAGEYTVDAAAITRWGGYVMAPYAVISLDEVKQARWAIQPLDFFRKALRLQLLPVPDTTTENGTRLLMTHVDGDGFASRNEFYPGGYPGETLYTDIWTHYKLPVALSVIEGEVGSQGLYPQLSPKLEALAQRMFALPYAEVASHTYSHPFEWDATVTHKAIEMGLENGPLLEDFHLPIKGYVYNDAREIGGTIQYINRQLTTSKKPVKLLLWPGSCDPPASAVRMAYQAGVLNVNGGDTLITKSNPSWTAIAPLGINKGEGNYQVFSANQNEDLYTNEWLGPFYGFERVIETFELTDQPYRFKPVDIYYHMYSGTKLAALKALKKVYDYALSKPNFPIYETEYARKVLDFENMAVAREGEQWIIRGAGDLRTMRIPADSAPQLDSAVGVVGYQAGPNGVYVHLAGDQARFTIGKDSDKGPYLLRANGRITNLQRTADAMSFTMESYVQPKLELARAARCNTRVNGKQVQLRAKGGSSEVIFPAGVAANVKAQIEVRCGG